jgi:hypothetical protein
VLCFAGDALGDDCGSARDREVALPGVDDAERARRRRRIPRGLRVGLPLRRPAQPDSGLLTQTEVLDAAARICPAVDVPVWSTSTGYGNAFNVERTVAELLAWRGGRFLEDQVAEGLRPWRGARRPARRVPPEAARRAPRAEAPFQ